MYKVLFVCVGATCRSPMASILFNRLIKEKNIVGVKSNFCGLNVQYGSKINNFAKAALKEYGVFRTTGTPTQINGKHLAENNLIVCLTQDYAEALKNMAADKFRDKIISFKDLGEGDVLDPYGKDFYTYQKCLAQISKSLYRLIEILKNQNIIKERKCSKK